MANFRTAFLRTLAFEDDPRHPGVVTPEPHGARARLGINSLAHPSLPDEFWTGPYATALDIAEKIYLREYWGPLQLDSVRDQDVANKVYDMAVNDGVGTAARMLQRVLGVPEDGRVGSVTLAATNAVAPGTLIQKLKNENAARYKRLAAQNPGEYGAVLKNWLERNEK